MVSPALLSSKKPDWETPESFLDLVRRVAPITLDPCTTAANPTKARFFVHPPFDGLAADWHGLWSLGAGGLIYVNPPYGRGINRWVAKCVEAGDRGATVLALLPARTDTRWFPWSADVLCFWKGRIKFAGANDPAPFPSVAAYWGDVRRVRFCDVFDPFGEIIQP